MGSPSLPPGGEAGSTEHLSSEAQQRLNAWLREPKYAAYASELKQMIAAGRWQELARVEKKLCNADFLSKAPEEVVAKQREEHARLMDTRTKLLQHLERIEHLLR